jgi:hypothetical protein
MTVAPMRSAICPVVYVGMGDCGLGVVKCLFR